MKELKNNIRKVCIFLCLMFGVLVLYGGYSVMVNGGRWFASASNTFVRSKKKDVIPGRIIDRNGVVLADNDGANLDENGMPKRIYHADPAVRYAMVHAVGNEKDYVKHGVESFMASSLYGFEMGMGERLSAFVQGQKRRGDDVHLTLDAALSVYATRLFPEGKKGALVVMNYKTGEVIGEISLPQFDPLFAATEAAALNRAVHARYAPGSTFKIITAAAALENDASAATRGYQCTGKLSVGEDQFVTDAGTDLETGTIINHGQLTLQRAFQVSCNNTFAQMALNLGDAKLRKTAENFGFNDNFLFRNVVVENSQYPTSNRTMREVAWTGVGQSELLATPLHMCMVAAAVANDGVMMEPYIVEKTVAGNGDNRTATTARVYRRAMEAETAAVLKEYMRLVVSGGTGNQAWLDQVSVCGKTGSAELDTQENTNAWFVGFMDSESHPYAIAVVVEDAGGGGSVAAPIAREVFRWMLNNGY